MNYLGNEIKITEDEFQQHEVYSDVIDHLTKLGIDIHSWVFGTAFTGISFYPLNNARYCECRYFSSAEDLSGFRLMVSFILPMDAEVWKLDALEIYDNNHPRNM